jgi:hypothetical protein
VRQPVGAEQPGGVVGGVVLEEQGERFERRPGAEQSPDVG